MRNMTLKTPFSTGKSLTITGVPNHQATHFAVNIGPNEDDIALHVNPRFNHYWDQKKVVFNSRHLGSWGSEIRDGGFPFFHEVEFKIIITFTGKDFVVTLSDGSKVVFHDRLGSEQYSVISVDGDVCITSFDIV